MYSLLDDDDDKPEFDLETDWHASPEYVASFFMANGWEWDIRGDLRSPTPQEVREHVMDLIDELVTLPAGMYLTSGRFKVYKDPEFPESYEIYLQVGHASPWIPEGSN